MHCSDFLSHPVTACTTSNEQPYWYSLVIYCSTLACDFKSQTFLRYRQCYRYQSNRLRELGSTVCIYVTRSDKKSCSYLNCMARHLLQNYSLQWAIAILKPTRFFAESTRFFAQPSRFFSLNQLGFFSKPTQFRFTEPTQ